MPHRDRCTATHSHTGAAHCAQVFYVSENILKRKVPGVLPWMPADAARLHTQLVRTLIAVLGCFLFGLWASVPPPGAATEWLGRLTDSGSLASTGHARLAVLLLPNGKSGCRIVGSEAAVAMAAAAAAAAAAARGCSPLVLLLR